VRDPRKKRPGKRIRSRGQPERADQARKKAAERLRRQQERQRRRQERERLRLLRLRLLHGRRGTGSWLYTLDERDEADGKPPTPPHKSGSLAGMPGGVTAFKRAAGRKRWGKTMKKLTRVG
jgi:hypothetical protein